MFDELANELKTAREQNSMSLAQVSNKSKIDIKFLEAMEQGDFAFLPDLYVRAFIKNFAKTVGLDENKIFKKYEAAKLGIPYVEEETPKKETVPPEEITEKPLEKPAEIVEAAPQQSDGREWVPPPSYGKEAAPAQSPEDLAEDQVEKQRDY